MIKAYREAYPKFTYDSPFATLEDNFNTLDFNKYETCPSGEAQEVQSSQLVKLRGRDTTKEVVDEQIVAQSEE
jgi:hypothetical protein